MRAYFNVTNNTLSVSSMQAQSPSSTLDSQVSRTCVNDGIFVIQKMCSNDIQRIDCYTTKEVAAGVEDNLQPPCIGTAVVYWKYLKHTIQQCK